MTVPVVVQEVVIQHARQNVKMTVVAHVIQTVHTTVEIPVRGNV